MRQPIARNVVWLLVLLVAAGTARAEIAWNYVKPASETGAGQWLSDILGLSEFGRDYAVIVGLNRFEGFNPLDATENDPQRMFDFLRDDAGFDNILMLRNEEVTYQSLRRLFEFELPQALSKNDRFLLFWSGHGTQFTDALGTELGYLPLTKSPANDKSTMVNMRDLARWDNELPAKQALFLLDACFSGLAGSTAQSDDQHSEIVELAKPGHHIISAGGRDQQTIASRQEWQGSIFTYSLLKALGGGSADRFGGKDGGGDGVINLHELVASIGETTKHAKAAAGWKRPLRPVLNSFRGEGQFFFLTRDKKKTFLETHGYMTGEDMVYGMPKIVYSKMPNPKIVDYDGRDERIFNQIKESLLVADFQRFIEDYPGSIYEPFARNRLEALHKNALLAPHRAEPEAAIDAKVVEDQLLPSVEDRLIVQQALAALGFGSYRVAGEFDANTRLAIASWQTARGFAATTFLNAKEHMQLLREAEWKRSVIRAEKSPTYNPVPASKTTAMAALKPFTAGDGFKDCAECPEMIVVPADRFTMGSPVGEEGRENDEGPRLPVNIAAAFAVGRFEVTFSEWDTCVAEGGCDGYYPADEGWGRGKLPVINVSWGNAKAYAAWLSRKTGQDYRLLSEAEWEFAARANTLTPFHVGPTISAAQANYDGRKTYGSGVVGKYRERTVAVGSFPANAFGLHDMHGNVWEWVEDCWHDSYDEVIQDGAAFTTGACRSEVLRGGSWGSSPELLRSASRHSTAPENQSYFIGFRVARRLTP